MAATRRSSSSDEDELSSRYGELHSSGDEEPSLGASADAAEDLTQRPAYACLVRADPIQVLAINDEHRRASAASADLWTAAEVARVEHTYYGYAVPTVVPPVWPIAPVLTQAEYDARFGAEFPLATAVLAKLAARLCGARCVVAGGAAAWPYTDGAVKAGDVDFFVILESAERRWDVLATIQACILEAVGDAHRAACVEHVLTPGVYTVRVRRERRYRARGRLIAKLQVILRAYPSVGALLHAFDVPAACVAYSGATTYLTTYGAYAQIHRVNVVNPAYRSTTYERRLAKYFRRGYALALPHLALSALAVGEVRLPHMTFHISAVRETRAVGTVASNEAAGPARHYDCALRELSEDLEFQAEWHNVQQLLAPHQPAYALVSWDGCEVEPATPLALMDFREFASYGEGRGPRLGDLLPAARLQTLIARVVSPFRRVERGARLSFAPLARYLGLTPEECASFALALLAAAQLGAVDASAALRPHCDALVAAYAGLRDQEVEWWLVNAPGRQYTASVEPRMEDPAAWYGAAVREGPPAPAARAAGAIRAALESRRAVCAICLCEVERGHANTVTLPCDHAFHWTDTGGGCGGLFGWIDGRSRGRNCPMCRDRFGAAPERRAGAAEPGAPPPARALVWRA